MRVRTRTVFVEARQFPGLDADLELQTSFDTWLILNQGGSLFRYSGNGLLISHNSDEIVVVRPGDWVVAADDMLDGFTKQSFDEKYEVLE